MSSTMRAVVLTGPGACSVQEVPLPVPESGEVVVDVERVGICGTDVELFTGEMAYFSQGHTSYPLRPGHEWCGRVSSVGTEVDPGWLGRRVVGDPLIGDGRCRRCQRGARHVCDNRHEVGVRDGRPGALAEKIAVPESSLHVLPDHVDSARGAMVEPGGNALRAALAAGVGEDDRALVLGPGTIGLLVALFLRASGVEVHLMGATRASLDMADRLGFHDAWMEGSVPDLPFDAVVDASNAAHLPSLALEFVEPAGTVVYIGLAGSPSRIDTRELALRDVTAVGILGASAGLRGAIDAYADGVVDPTPLVAATVCLEEVADVLAGQRPRHRGAGPKVHVDPRPNAATTR